jgi:hypothetical protein
MAFVVIGPALWAKAIEQTIDVPKLIPQIAVSLGSLTLCMVFAPLSANGDFGS